MIEPDSLDIGSAASRQHFEVRHAAFFAGGRALRAATSAAFDRPLPEDASHADKVVFFLGVRAVADFGAITVLAANGLGLNALALVRGLYERVVTAAYIHEHPGEGDSFLNYTAIQNYRVLNRLADVYEFDGVERSKFDEIKAARDAIANHFTRAKCRECGRAGMPNWTELDFVSMAKLTGTLADALAPAYDVPLQQAHATPISIISMLTYSGDALTVRHDYTAEADRAFQLAHGLLLHALDLQVSRFGDPNVKVAVEAAAHHYVAVWQSSPAGGA